MSGGNSMKTINNIANEVCLSSWNSSQDNTTADVWSGTYYEIWGQVWERIEEINQKIKEELKEKLPP